MSFRNYTCERCRVVSLKWAIKCDACGAWQSLVEARSKNGYGAPNESSHSRGPTRLGDMKTTALERFSTRLPELDRVLGGGAVRGASVLLGGDAGIGKSTLLLHTLSGIAANGERALYVSGEESEEQIAARAGRLGGISPELLVLSERDVDVVLEIVEHARPRCLVVDSAQTLRATGIDGVAGGMVQTKHITALLVEQTQRLKCTLFLVCHITKGGDFAGPKTLEHLVDTVLFFEGVDTKRRKLVSEKNRHGSTTETALFEMCETGLRGITP